MKLPKQIVYTLLLISLIIPLVLGISMEIKPTLPVINFYNALNKLHSGNFVIVSLSYDPSTKAELTPMLKTLTYHLLKRGIIPVFMNLKNIAIGDLGYKVVKTIGEDLNKKENKDFYYLGYAPGDNMAVQKMGEDFFKVYDHNFHGDLLDKYEIHDKIKVLKDFKYLIDISDGNSTIDYLTYVNTKYKVPMIAGVTAVMASEYYPYIQSKQLLGLLGGLRGAAEYETLLDINGDARKGMSAQTFAHILILFLIILGNIEFFYFRKKRKNGNAD
ncbi:hypothetical protein J7L48_08640 [bacterium]|nr:hypothetical protein [bacterium]